MNKPRLYSAALLLTPAIFCHASLAQEEAPPNIGAVEIYMCSYAEGKDAADLGKVVNKWNG